MPAQNQILPFAQGGGANVLTQLQYAGDAQLTVGNQPGVARSAFHNKSMLQSSAVAAGVAQFLADSQVSDITDQITPASFSSIWRAALNGGSVFITQAASDNSNKPATTAFVQAAISSTIGAGQIAFYPATSPPAGYLKLNGALLNRVTYAGLWAYAQASGNMTATDAAWNAGGSRGSFSPGDGSTTFRIPDYRGFAVRAWDDAAGVDSGRVIGSSQNDQFPAHSHTITDPGHSHSVNDPSHFHTNSDPGHSHITAVPYKPNGTGSGPVAMVDGINGLLGYQNIQSSTQTVGIAINYAYTGITIFSGVTGITSTNVSGTGSETRVKNMAALACIKF
jgi:microcystin-dependent protein